MTHDSFRSLRMIAIAAAALALVAASTPIAEAGKAERQQRQAAKQAAKRAKQARAGKPVDRTRTNRGTNRGSHNRHASSGRSHRDHNAQRSHRGAHKSHSAHARGHKNHGYHSPHKQHSRTHYHHSPYKKQHHKKHYKKHHKSGVHVDLHFGAGYTGLGYHAGSYHHTKRRYGKHYGYSRYKYPGSYSRRSYTNCYDDYGYSSIYDPYHTSYRKSVVRTYSTAPIYRDYQRTTVIEVERCDAGDAWEDLEHGRWDRAQVRFATLAEKYEYDGLVRIGFAIAALKQHREQTGVWAMRRALVVDAEALLDVPLNSRLERHVDALSSRIRQSPPRGLPEADRWFLAAALETIAGRKYVAMEALDKAAEYGDDEASSHILRDLLRDLDG